MTVFHYGFANPMNSRIKIERDTVKCDYHKITGITFLGYPMLRIDDLILEDCAFEDCHSVYFSDCKVNNCQFYGVEAVYAEATSVEGCDFEQILKIKHLGKTVVTEVVTLLHSLGVEGSAWDYLV